MLHLQGEESFSQTAGWIWDHLTDAEFLSQCIPGLQSVTRTKKDQLLCRVRPGFSFMRGTLGLTLEIFDRQPPKSARIRIEGKGIGSSVTVLTNFELSETESSDPQVRTRLHWSAQIEKLGGLLKPVGQTLIEAAAKKVLTDGWSKFRKEIELAALSAGTRSSPK